jgi:hypothetical protein
MVKKCGTRYNTKAKTGVKNKFSNMINFFMNMCIIKMAIPPTTSSVRRAKVSLY